MTIPNVSAGRELDALIAQHVFGWEFRRGHCASCACSHCGRAYEDCWGSCFFSDAEDADPYRVIQAMRAKGFQFQCNDHWTDEAPAYGPWYVEFALPDKSAGGQGMADSLPLAVCHAALVALGVPL